MTTRLLNVVIALTRAWLRVYTSRTPPPLADARRAEIESDIWEMRQDDDLGSDGSRVRIATRRLFEGIPDDIAWHFENAAPEEQMMMRRVIAVAAAAAVVLSLWAVPTMVASGRREVANCAATAAELHTNADLRFEVMRCAGAFFLRSSPRPGR